MRVVITGATGFLGRNLALGLHADGLEVIASGRSTAVGAQLEAAGIPFQAADLANEDQLRRAFANAECVIHCAARSGPWGAYQQHFEANVEGTRRVIAACHSHGIERLLFISTPGVYFSHRDRLDVRETDPLPSRQLSHYSATKLIAEAELTAAAARGDLEVLTLRPRALHGPFDSIFTPRILRMASSGSVPLIDGGHALVDVTYVENCVDAIRLALAATDDAWNAVYNISNGDPITVRQWYQGVVEASGMQLRAHNVPLPVARARAALAELSARLPWSRRPPLLTRASVDYLAWTMTMSIDAARTRLGYTPRVGNQEGFERTAAWFRSRSPR
jgi:nucleoside-diphosphate-sugar epimerase